MLDAACNKHISLPLSPAHHPLDPPIIVGDGDWKPTTDDLSHSRSGLLILLYTSWQGLSCLFKLNTHRFIALPLHTSEIPS